MVMEVLPISQQLLQFIDDTWIYLVPIAVAIMARGFIGNLIAWALNRWSKMDYYSEGGCVMWNGKWQTVFKMTFTHVALFYMEDSDVPDREQYETIKDLSLKELVRLLKLSKDKMIITVVSNTDYRKREKTFKAKF